MCVQNVYVFIFDRACLRKTYIVREVVCIYIYIYVYVHNASTATRSAACQLVCSGSAPAQIPTKWYLWEEKKDLCLGCAGSVSLACIGALRVAANVLARSGLLARRSCKFRACCWRVAPQCREGRSVLAHIRHAIGAVEGRGTGWRHGAKQWSRSWRWLMLRSSRVRLTNTC